MKRKKLKFMNIGEHVLTRNDMKNIIAGSGGSNGMMGQAEILNQDMRLLERFILQNCQTTP